MNLACRNQRLPCTGVLDATPHGTFGCGQTDRALLRTRHSLLCRERGWRSYRPGQINLRLTALGSHSEAYRERGIEFLAAAGHFCHADAVARRATLESEDMAGWLFLAPGSLFVGSHYLASIRTIFRASF